MRAVKARAKRVAEAKAEPCPSRVKLERGDYYELRTRIRDVEAVELDAKKAAEAFARRMTEAEQASNATFIKLAKQYGFCSQKTWGWDDATCELVEKPPQEKPA